MKKQIIFVLDSFDLCKFDEDFIFCYSYFDTEEAINNHIPYIITYDIGHLSFDLEDLGYEIYIVYNGYYKQFYTGMVTANGKELRMTHNLRRLLIGGALDNDLKIPKSRFWYDTSKSTHELLEDEKSKQLSLALKVVEKTIGFDIKPVKFEDMGKEIKNLVEKCSEKMFGKKITTNGANGITEPLIAQIKK